MPIPNNIADAASAIKDGVLGAIEEVKIGDLLVDVLTDLSNPSSLRVTRKPIEEGYAITDAAVDEINDLFMTICLANPEFSVDAGLSAALSGDPGRLTETWRDKRDQLKQLQADRELVTVQTHEGTYNNMLVQAIDPIWDVAENSDAFIASVTLTPVTVNEVGSEGGLLDKAKEALGGL